MSEELSGVKRSLPSVVFEHLLQLLEAKIEERLAAHPDTNKLSQKPLWDRLRENKSLHRELFRTDKYAITYFTDKKDQIGSYDDDPVAIGRDILCDALEFLGYKVDTEKSIPYSKKIKLLGEAFLKEYFEDRPEFVQYLYKAKNEMKIIVLRSREEKRQPTTQPQADIPISLFDRHPGNKFERLDKKFFTVKYKQGDMIDYGFASFHIEQPNIVQGTYTIFYEQWNNTYPHNPETLEMRGYFFPPNIVSLTVVNKDEDRTHVGNLLLKFTDGDLDGHFMVDYDNIPDERKKERTGPMTLMKARFITNDEDGLKHLELILKAKRRYNDTYQSVFNAPAEQ